jgi:hypothetical protein
LDGLDGNIWGLETDVLQDDASSLVATTERPFDTLSVEGDPSPVDINELSISDESEPRAVGNAGGTDKTDDGGSVVAVVVVLVLLAVVVMLWPDEAPSWSRVSVDAAGGAGVVVSIGSDMMRKCQRKIWRISRVDSYRIII